MPVATLEDSDLPSEPEPENVPPGADDAIDALLAKFAPDAAGEETPAEAPSSPQEPAEAAPAPQVPPPAPAAAQASQEPAAATPGPQERNLAILAERQRAIRAEQESLAAERAALKAERESVERDLAKWRAVEAKLMRQDALGALSDMGVKLDDLNRAVLEGRGVNPTSQLEATLQSKLQETEARLAQRLDGLQKAEHARLERAFQAEVRAELSARSPLLAAMGDTAVAAIYQRFQEHAHRGEQLPSYEDAIRDVEREALDFIRPLLETETVRGLIPRQPKDASPTLSNQQAAAAPTRTQQDPLPSYYSPHDDNDAYIDALMRKHNMASR